MMYVMMLRILYVRTVCLECSSRRLKGLTAGNMSDRDSSCAERGGKERSVES